MFCVPERTAYVARRHFTLGCVSTLATFALVSAPALSQTHSNEVSGVTRPSQERKLSFSTQGVVAQAPVKEGDVVKVGQTILVQDDVIDKKELERLELASNSKRAWRRQRHNSPLSRRS